MYISIKWIPIFKGANVIHLLKWLLLLGDCTKIYIVKINFSHCCAYLNLALYCCALLRIFLKSLLMFCYHSFKLQKVYFLSSSLKFTLSVSLSSPDSLPWRVQVQGELAPKQLQRLWVSGLQRLLHSTQQAWPSEEGQQGHHCHDCNALPTQNMMSKNWQ